MMTYLSLTEIQNQIHQVQREKQKVYLPKENRNSVKQLGSEGETGINFKNLKD